MAPRPILVCGSNYGQAWVRAIRGIPEECSVAGLLARGSHRSRRLAEGLGVPLYRDPDELPAGLDAACVALPSSEGVLLPRLLARGIAVLSEHPAAPATLEAALEASAAGGPAFHLHGHFCHLDAPRAFIEAARTLAAEAEPLFVDVLAADRFLWAAFDVLGQALGRLEPLGLEGSPAGPPVHALHGVLAGAPCTVQAQHRAAGTPGEDLPDGSPDYFADLRISLTLPMGALVLLSVTGPVVWTWNVARGIGGDDALAPRLLHGGVGMEEFRAQRLWADQAALRRLLAGERTGPPPDQEPAHLRSVARAWERAGRAFGW